MFCQSEWHWETQECCTIHHLGACTKEQNTLVIQRENEYVCVVCVRECYVSSFFFWEIHREWKLGKFSLWSCGSDRLMGVSLALYLRLLWWPDTDALVDALMSHLLSQVTHFKAVMTHWFSPVHQSRTIICMVLFLIKSRISGHGGWMENEMRGNKSRGRDTRVSHQSNKS